MATIQSLTPPASISVITGTYTLPADRFARVTVEVDSGGLFTLNGTTAVSSAAFQNVDQASTASGNMTYTVPSNYRAIGLATTNPSSGADQLAINGNTPANMTALTNYENLHVGPGGTIAIVSVNTGGKSITGVAIPSNATHRQAVFIVPPSTTLNGSGNWRAVVEEYLA